MITYLLNTLVDSIKTSLINKLGLDPSTEVDLDDFPQLIDDIPILGSVEELTVTQNGTYTGTDGVTYNPVNVNLPLGTKTITANGTYNASDDSLQGYSSVTVDIDDTDLYRDTTDSTYESVKTLSNCGAFPMLSLTAEINAVQDLHGYDSPWVGGAGKNKINLADIVTASIGFVYNREPVSIAVNTYTLSFNFIGNSGSISISLRNGETVVSTLQDQPLVNGLNTYTLPILSDNADSISLYAGISGTYENFMLNEGSTALPYEPYSNICPITGWDSIDVYQSGADTSNPTTHTTALSTTCYGATKELISGAENITHGHIASYNGETLPGAWISDRDEYAEGTTPTIGAEVVYELATPTTATSDAIDLTLAEGVNNIWANSGNVGDARYFRKVEL